MNGDSFNSQGGDQNIGQGDHAIGKQENIRQNVDGHGNIIAGSGDVHINHLEQHLHSAPLPRIPRQLPPLDACFLGRDKELADVTAQLHPGKVAAICGPGGMGKSALAAQAVSKLEPARFPDGIVFHSFYHQPKVETALQAICASFQAEAKTSLESTVRQLLSGKQALLILDGAEEADDLPALLKLHGQCGVLITSRKNADAPDEPLELKRLEKPAAEAVFRHYSKMTGDAESVAGICTLLDGWPVALRIAGRYLRRTKESAADYLEWLEQEPLKELASGQHQEENAALLLRRSVAQVSADARLALGMAGCLAFAPLAREPLAFILDGDERKARAALNELVNYGLLEKRDERWQTSHALIHAYARTELALSTESLERLAASYISFCRVANAGNANGYAILDAERAHCLSLTKSCLNSKLWQEVKRLVWVISDYLDRQGHWADRLTVLGMRLTASQQSGDRKDEAVCLNNLGYTCWRRGECEQALSWYEQSLPIHREVGNRREEGKTLNNMAAIYNDQGKHELALQQYEQCLTIMREIGDRKGESATLNNIANVYMHQSEWETALLYFEQCLPIRQEAGDKIGEGATLNNIAVIYRVRGDYAKALEQLEQALAICQRLGYRAEEAATHWNFGLTYDALDDLAKSEEYISQAVQIAEQIGHPSLEKYSEGLARVRTARRG